MTTVEAAARNEASQATTTVRQANEAWEALMGAYATLMRRFAAEDMWCEVSLHEYDVLYTLSTCPSAQRLGELGRHLMLSQPGLSRLVERLVARGLLARQPDPADARATLLSLTEEGRAVQQRVGRAHARSVADAMASRLTPDQMSTLAALAALLNRTEEELS
ncbi:MarR family transcriptional regulator [Demequina sp. TTPB684]|uniref:MarR family winged helix-turn-helix transcriptional regulator n=1 Tax=unclassified Demequina TaxID=2620311 RepID=UPI001CF3FD19|nr:MULTISPECIES: MarR family transcriptional regulator [unclassified Demequina]MCB2412745.1 MarR family transcriptional regulator [Demequina sp. TTPB684]UPU88877.1 MarR family transcriptional regulator [Demequina sp. TMPB413]